MDVDDEQTSGSTDYLSLFDLSPSTFPFRSPRPYQIETRRADLSDLLIFDILLASGGARQPDALYPPTDADSLAHLLQVIEESTYDALKKDCLVYFLLKWHEDGREEAFTEEKCLPPQFVSLVEAYWHLDSGVDIPKAVSILSDARLNSDYASKILQIISLSPNSAPLVIRYVRTAKPPLTEPDDLDIYTLALAETSLLDAWQFQRTFPEGGETRSRLLRKTLDWCLSPKPRAQPLSHLLAFPFTTYEQSQVHAYALKPPHTCPASSVHVVQDLVCVRLIQSGLYASAVKLDRQFSLNVRDGKATKAAQDRRRMMEDIMATMPSVERDMLQVELEEIAQGKPSESDLSMSWEDLGRSVGNGAPKAPLSERAGAPRFGGSLNGKTPARESFTPIPVSVSHQQVNGLPASTSKPATPLSAPSFKPGRFIPTPPSRPSPSAAAPKNTQPMPASMFDSSRSANHTRNAFYNPPPANGRPPVMAPPPPPEEVHTNAQDVSMESEDELLLAPRNGADHADARDPSPTPELSFSVFGASSSAPKTYAPRSRAPSKPKVIPGAYVADAEEEVEEVHHRRSSPPPPPPPKTTRLRARKADLGRSVPGNFVSEDEDEEEDEVAPLPPSPPAKRKGRTRAAPEEPQDNVRPRRSTRLSVAPSPDPSPPKPKAKRSTRNGATATKTRAKKRS